MRLPAIGLSQQLRNSKTGVSADAVGGFQPFSSGVGTYKAAGPCVRRPLKRWRSKLWPDMAVLKATKSEAIGWFKEQLGLKQLPPDANIESY